MSALDVLKQSVYFYRHLFNKIILISTVSNALPLLIAPAEQSTLPLPVVFFILFASLFCTVWLMVFIHRYSQLQDSSLKASVTSAFERLFPIVSTFIVMGFALTILSFPAALLGALLGAGQSEDVQPAIMLVCMLIPMLFLSYRWFLAPYATLVDGLQPIDAIKRSNQQAKTNPLVLRGFLVVAFIFVVYTASIVILHLMIAVNPALIEMAKFVINVVVGPILTIYVYRLYVLTRLPSDEDVERG